MKKIIIISAFILPSIVFAQDIHFSQALYSPLTLNPALAGANYDLETNINYRTQWNSVAEPYNTIGASASARLNTENRTRKVNVALGLNFFNDKAGSGSVLTNNGNLSLATHFLLKNGQSFGTGIYLGGTQRSYNYLEGKWGSQYNGMEHDPTMVSGETFDSPSFSFIDAGAGIVYTLNTMDKYTRSSNPKKINAGFAVFHVNRPNYSFISNIDEKLYMKFSAFFNGSFKLKDKPAMIEPAIYIYQQGNAREIIFGTYGRFILNGESRFTGFRKQSTLALGLFCRNQDALIAKAQYDFNGIGFGFSYDFNILSSLTSLSRARGGMEFSLRWVLPDFHAAYIR